MATFRRLRRPSAGSLLFLLAATACNQLLSIDPANHDPSLDPMGGSAGSTSSGGKTEERGGAAGSSPTAAGGTTSAQGGMHSHTSGGTQLTEHAGAGGDAGNAEGGLGGEAGSPVDSAGSAGSAGAAGAPSNPGTVCDQYCTSITQFCTGSDLQYKDYEQCRKICGLFTPGSVGAQDSNSAACRLKYAEKARYAGGTELQAYCRQAGPGGDGRCGGDCDGFCDIAMATCTEGATAPYYFESRGDCMSTCRTLPEYPFTYGDEHAVDGNSAQCRLFHVMSAAMADAEEHCAHVLGITLCESE